MIHISNNLYLTRNISSRDHPIVGYETILTISNTSATSDPDATPVVNLVNDNTYQYWLSDSLSEQYINITNTNTDNVNFVGIAKHNLGTGGILYQLQGSEGGSPEVWVDLTDEVIPEDDRAIFHYFDDSDYALYRLRIVPDATLPTIANIKLGEALVMQRGIYVGHRPINYARRTDSIINTSENGNYLGSIITREYLETGYEFTEITPAFYRQYIDPFAQAVSGAKTTFYIAWKPLTYATEVAYGWTRDNIPFSNDRPNGFGSFGFNVKAIA